MASKSILVANPTARTGKAAPTIERAQSKLDEFGLQAEFFPTLPDGATVAALAERIEKGDVARVIYLGGDGTFADAAKGIVLARERGGVDVPLGMLPMGTANNQGRSFGIMAGERAIDDNVKIIANGTERWLDAGRILAYDEEGEVLREDLWFDSCGMGLSALILAQRNESREVVANVPVLRQFYRDKLLYVGASIRRFFGTMMKGWRFSCAITVDGETTEHTDCTDLIVLGTLLYGGDWIFAPDSKPDDGKFEVVVVKGHGEWVRATLRDHKRNPVTDDDREVMGIPARDVIVGREIELRFFRSDGDPLPSQIDGEEWTAADHYRVENLFHHLRIIVPDEENWV